MHRRQFLSQIATAAATLPFAPLACSRPQAPAARKPNIVYIMADDLGYGELGCYGQQKIKTPNIDQLANQGLRFTDFYSGAPVCAPARCNLITGKHAGHAFVRDNHPVKGPEEWPGQLPLPPQTRTLAHMLKDQGYATGCFGKWGLGHSSNSGDPSRMGFDRFFGYKCQAHAHNLYPKYLDDDLGLRVLEGNSRSLTGKQYGPQVIADEALKFVHQNRDKPFFLYYATVLPHLALQAPEEDIAQYRGQWPETPYTGRSYLPHPTPRACYAAMISFADKQVGRLMNTLRELGLDRNTIVFFTSDNGPSHLNAQVDVDFFNSAGPLNGLKGSVYEGGIRVPMIARWPGRIKPATTTNHPAANYDIFATLADLTNAPTPDTDGLSLLPTLLDQPGQKTHQYLFWDFAGYTGQLAVRMGKWKGLKRNLTKNPNAPLQLYNLETDLAEQHDVANQYPQIAQKIESIMLSARTKPQTPRFQFGQYNSEPQA